MICFSDLIPVTEAAYAEKCFLLQYFDGLLTGRIILGYQTWLDEVFIRKSLETWLPYVDGLVVQCGKFPYSLPDEKDQTLDIIRQVMAGQRDKSLIIDETEGYEYELRTKMMEKLFPGDYLFMVDPDELPSEEKNVKSAFDFIRSNIPEFSIFWMKVEEIFQPTGIKQDPWKAKIFRVEKGYHFYPNHLTLLDGQNNLVTDWNIQDRKDWVKVPQMGLENRGFLRGGRDKINRSHRYELLTKVQFDERKL